MKKHIAFILILMTVLLTAAMPKSAEDPIHTLARIANTNQLSITGWEVTLKESLPFSNFNHIVNNAKSSHFVAVKETKNSIIYDIEPVENTNSIEVTQRLVLAKNNEEEAELIIVLQGTNWNEQIREEYNQIKQEMTQTYFTDEVQAFTCLELVEDDIIVQSAIIEIFEETLGLVHNETQVEKNELSKLKNVIYGYTPLWSDEFIIEGIPYNLQIATSENENGKWAYTIGTPILVNEY